MDAITRVIANCCWLNMHIVPPHGAVFEIRVADGYGARWSQDGTKVFILSYVFIFEEFLNSFIDCIRYTPYTYIYTND